MEYEKMLYLTNAATAAAVTQMPQNQTLAPPSSFKLGEVVTNQYLPATEQYTAYADNFDLSLLPQDNIPTTVYQYNNNNNNNSSNNNKLEPPQIKIEDAWCVDIKQEQPYSLLYEQPPQQQLHQQPQQQQQQQQLLPTYTNKSNNQLIPPPPAYPHIYPSPQSSPAQSDYSASFASAQFGGYYDSLSSSRTSLYASSPCPSLDASCIKQELHILPPSPPESNCETPSPRSACNESIKSEPFDADVERLIDLNTLLLEKSYVGGGGGGVVDKQTTSEQQQQQQDHQLLREYLEDTTFQKKHNLKPLALESFIGGLAEVRGDFEPVISLALEHAKREADAICAKLQISQDPNAWTPPQVHAWLRSTIAQFKLPQCDSLELKFCENGAALMLLTEEEFMRRLPEIGSTLHAQLEIWKMAYADGYQQSNPTNANEQNSLANVMQMQEQQLPSQLQSQPQSQSQPTQPTQTQGLWSANYMQMDLNDDSEDEDADMPANVNNGGVPLANVAAAAAPTNANNNSANGNGMSVPPTTTKRTSGARNGGSHIHLWQFLKELLAAPHINGTAIRWIDRTKGIFKIEDSVRVAKLWGRRKNRPAMNYDKLSRSIRQYYKKGIMKKTERSQRLVYQFCHPYHQ